MKDICPVHILDQKVSLHLFNHDLDQLRVPMIRRKVQRCESFICRHIDPIPDSFRLLLLKLGFLGVCGAFLTGDGLTTCQIVIKGVFVDDLEAMIVILKRCK